MYNYPGQGQYGPPPGMGGGYPGQQGPPPGMGAPGMGPPGMIAPGVGPAPGMQQAQSPTQGGFPPSFQPPANMPNINFSAPVIRLGTTGPSKPDTPVGGQSSRKDSNQEPLGNRRNQGLGYDSRNYQDQQRHQMRDNVVSLQPPSREEVARTIFIGNITDGCGGDEGIQRILNASGGLRKWIRGMDADSKPSSFGFAEYEDADSLAIACEIFTDVEIPDMHPATNGFQKEDEQENGGGPSKSKLLLVVDENSQNYMDEWRARGSMRDPAEQQFRIDSAREELNGILANLSRAAATEQANAPKADADGDARMQDTEIKVDGVTGEVVTIPLTIEDELADIPAEMRETVAKEIAAFRDRSNRRDLERLKREEEIEQAEKQRNMGDRYNRLATPPPSASSQANGVPVGPRDRAVQGAPLGPRGYQGVQIPRDYQKGVAFVSSTGVNGVTRRREDEDSDASDEELERRRQEQRQTELEKIYLDQERRWLNRERQRTAAVERIKQGEKDEEARKAKEKENVAARLKEWNDDTEATRKVEEYYRDRSEWLRNRASFRMREAEHDERDRAAEDVEKAKEQERKNRDLGMADQFLAQQAEELESRVQTREPQRFKMSLGAAAQRAQQAAAPKRTLADVEGLLEDEEDAAQTNQKRTLVPISFDKEAGGPALSEEERAEAAKQIAGNIPTDKEGLWAWDVKWDFVDDSVITEQLRPFVEKKIVEYLGVQEQMLVDVVEDHIKKRGKPQELVGDLEEALDEEAEPMVRKLWRMLIFFSESEKAGISG